MFLGRRLRKSVKYIVNHEVSGRLVPATGAPLGLSRTAGEGEGRGRNPSEGNFFYVLAP